MGKTLYRISLGSLIVFFTTFNLHVFAQSPPTATEAFNLRIQCKKMSDQKAQERIESNTALKWEYVAAWNTSKYDLASNRCYGRIYTHITKPNYHFDNEYDELYDLQTDDLVANAAIQNGKKHGNIGTRITKSLGFHRVQKVASQILALKRGKLPRIT
jgi:hypothetical protein